MTGHPFKAVFLACATFLLGSAALAQSEIEQMPVLDCEIGAPAPENSCLLRLPATYKSRRVSAVTDDGENYGSSWGYVGRNHFSGNEALSGTLVLVDITLGKGNGRNGPFTRKERDLIRKIVERLPDQEAVAIYTFDTEIKKVSGFTTNRASSLQAVDGLKLTGLQTWIGSNIVDAVKILKANDNFVMKSVIVISDGLDESKVSPDEVIAAAQEARVSVSAMGGFWRPQGHADNGTGGAYLNKIAKNTLGEYAGITLGRADADADAAEFANALRWARSESRLVSLKDGEPAVPGTITVTVERPVLGDAERSEEVTFSAKFTPKNPTVTEPEAEVEVVVEPEKPDVLAILKLYWYFAAGVGIIVLVLFFLLLRRGKTEDESGLEFGDSGADIDLDDDSDHTQASEDVFVDGIDADQDKGPVVAPQRVAGYLFEKTTGQRMPIGPDRSMIGRGSQNDIVVSDSSVSRVHASIVAHGGGQFIVSDLGSLNGTFVNDKKISGEQVVHAGDIIRLGEYALILQDR